MAHNFHSMLIKESAKLKLEFSVVKVALTFQLKCRFHGAFLMIDSRYNETHHTAVVVIHDRNISLTNIMG